jgi:hypothetical protein
MLRECAYSVDGKSAYEHGFINTVKMIVNRGELDQITLKESEATYEKGHHKLIKLLSKVGYQIDKEMILTASCRYGHIILVKMIMNTNPRLNRNFLNKLIIRASRKGFIDIVELLASHGAYPNDPYINVLFSVSFGGYYRVIRYLLTNYEFSQEQIDDAMDFESINKVKDVNVRILKYILTKGGDINIAVGQAAYINDIKLTMFLIDKGAEINQAMCGAISRNHLELVKTLLTMGGDPNMAYIQAYNCRHHDIISYLLSYGIDKEMILLAAIRLNELLLVNHILTLGADVHADNNRALRNAMADNNEPIVRILLETAAK